MCCLAQVVNRPPIFAGSTAAPVNVSIAASRAAKVTLTQKASVPGSAAEAKDTWITRCAAQVAGMTSAISCFTLGVRASTSKATVSRPRTVNPVNPVGMGQVSANATANTPKAVARLTGVHSPSATVRATVAARSSTGDLAAPHGTDGV
ncbi:hypothetical protein GCM10023321_73330 [Pseudonocardia eucalypti]|uniref:Uncharacterized protein n=1 Tax=Pseudonocardia eucalypti TaxID=648755 RepID=A0ABP9R827_9PSEU